MGLCGIEARACRLPSTSNLLVWDWRPATVEPPEMMSGEGGGLRAYEPIIKS